MEIVIESQRRPNWKAVLNYGDGVFCGWLSGVLSESKSFNEDNHFER